MILFILKTVSFLASLLPLGFVLFVGRFVGRLAYLLDSRHRKTAIENLDRAFGNTISAEDKKNTTRQVFENIGMTLLESLRIPWLRPHDLDGYVRFEGIRNLENALSRKKGVIFYTAHFGNWELMAASMALKGYSGSVVARPLDMEVFE
ncbi:MAG: hypothetical protein HY880_04265, partial [Deltaproteobacteria bacterium]|nr:hypothetical protein [Deltaproteobacteria bacterium]